MAQVYDFVKRLQEKRSKEEQELDPTAVFDIYVITYVNADDLSEQVRQTLMWVNLKTSSKDIALDAFRDKYPQRVIQTVVNVDDFQPE